MRSLSLLKNATIFGTSILPGLNCCDPTAIEPHLRYAWKRDAFMPLRHADVKDDVRKLMSIRHAVGLR